MSEVLRTTSESPTVQVRLMSVALLLQLLDTLLQHAHKLKGLSRHDGCRLKGDLTGQETSVVVLTTQQPRLHKIRHLNLIIRVRKGLVTSPNGIRQTQVIPGRSLPGLGSPDHLGIKLCHLLVLLNRNTSKKHT